MANSTSIYRYYDKNDFLIYVGITGRGIARNVEHNNTKDWWHFVARQEIEHCPTRRSAEVREAELIRKHAPPFNTQHNQDHDAARSAYLLTRHLVAPGGVKCALRNRLAGVVINVVGNRVTIAVSGDEADKLVIPDSGITVMSSGRKAKLCDAGSLSGGKWIRLLTPDADKVIGALVMFKGNPQSKTLPVKLIELSYGEVPVDVLSR